MNDFDKVIQKLTELGQGNKISLTMLIKDLSRKLTKRQERILNIKIKGYKNIEIAKKLKVCPATITNEMKKIKTEVKRYLS